MIIGIPKEVKDHEYRVGATPSMVQALTQAGHQVKVQKSAGKRIGFSDLDYESSGAEICQTLEDVYDSEMIIKVKEPQSKEYPLLKEGQILFCYLHLAPDPDQAEALIQQKVVGIAYETVQDRDGRLPLLTPMSEVAGRLAIQAGATALQMAKGGRGVLLGGVPGVCPGKVVIVGGGVVGTQSAKMAVGLGADVTILDHNMHRLRELDDLFNFRLKTVYSTPLSIEEEVKCADLVVGAVLIPGKTAPKLISKKMVEQMKGGSVIVDVAIDQGGCFETSKPTTHSNPTFVYEGVVHYCVTNMPGACARTSTQALTNSIFPYVLQLANLGYQKALSKHPYFLQGLNVCRGKVTNKHVAIDLGYQYHPPEKCL